VRLKGLPVRKASIKCETSKRVHSGGGDVEVVNLTTRLDPADSYLYFFAERDVSGGGWKPIGADQIKTSNASWASKYSPRNMTDIIGGSFRHTKFNIFDKRDYACARGNTVGTKMARGSGEARHHSWIIYCEKGAHTVSDENLGKVYSALSFE
jgi:hypothetical protein